MKLPVGTRISSVRPRAALSCAVATVAVEARTAKVPAVHTARVIAAMVIRMEVSKEGVRGSVTADRVLVYYIHSVSV